MNWRRVIVASRLDCRAIHVSSLGANAPRVPRPPTGRGLRIVVEWSKRGGRRIRDQVPRHASPASVTLVALPASYRGLRGSLDLRGVEVLRVIIHPRNPRYRLPTACT